MRSVVQYQPIANDNSQLAIVDTFDDDRAYQLYYQHYLQHEEQRRQRQQHYSARHTVAPDISSARAFENQQAAIAKTCPDTIIKECIASYSNSVLDNHILDPPRAPRSIPEIRNLEPPYQDFPLLDQLRHFSSGGSLKSTLRLNSPAIRGLCAELGRVSRLWQSLLTSETDEVAIKEQLVDIMQMSRGWTRSETLTKLAFLEDLDPVNASELYGICHDPLPIPTGSVGGAWREVRLHNIS